MLLNLFWLLATSLIAVQAQNSDQQVLVSYKESGTCMLFVPGAGESAKESEVGVSPCKTWCPAHKGKDQTIVAVWHPHSINTQDSWIADPFLKCIAPGVTDFDKYPQFTNDAGHKYIPGRCSCTPAKDIIPFVEVVAKGLSKLDNILCAVGMSTWESIAEMALDIVPGGADVQASVDAAVTAAKTFAENDLDSDSFQKFIEDTCHISNWDFSFPLAFGKLKRASSTRGVNQGCMKKSKGECKPVGNNKPDKPDRPTTTKGHYKPTLTKDEPTMTSTKDHGHLQACQ